ncbi:hypothetical protein CEUSTIGMA_g9665.t1 [Chlamydomonas eustigma]|uniref:Sugar phosphate transporter domain-containing protein n=1 Tax=Chlamydomonas eustigma TaxID=1157962 RepID=A0A250XGN7_9CHLO|nr:hypothetical protein CEUSTIGMA_g9665.t1 [Chlamydomonas eustigma]|eukprot:GAX82237.1 hypothetical protein CEUSTIGMA_g9665.t1 [Chlamydomonas eustigma]
MASQPYSRLLLGVVGTGLWMFFSSSLIILNKNLYKNLDFQRPFFVTGMGQLFSFLGGLSLVGMGVLPLRPVPKLSFCVTRLLPIVLSSTATMFFGNTTYLYLSLSFIQILKAFTPALTLLLCVIVGLERMHWPLVLSIALITFGTANAVIEERGAPSFKALGLFSFLASSLTEASRVVGAEVLLGAQRFNSAEALVYIGGPTAVFLLLGAVVWEGMGPTSDGWAVIAQTPSAFLAAFTMSFLVNLSCYFAIQYTSSLTFKVAGCVKNIGVVWYGIVAHKEHVTLVQMAGYAVSIIGFAIYSKLKMSVKALSEGRNKLVRV